MKYNKLTDFAIFILVAAAVFQTGKLWLGNTDSHNFFYSLYTSSVGEVGDTDKDYDIIEPEKTVVGYGNRKFNMLYSDDDMSSVTALSEKSHRRCVQKRRVCIVFKHQLERLYRRQSSYYEVFFLYVIERIFKGIRP